MLADGHCEINARDYTLMALILHVVGQMRLIGSLPPDATDCSDTRVQWFWGEVVSNLAKAPRRHFWC